MQNLEIATQYSGNKFVERKKILQSIQKIIKAISKSDRSELDSRRTLHILGERGTGKTWLLKCLHYAEFPEISTSENKKISSFYIDFESRRTIPLEKKEYGVPWHTADDGDEAFTNSLVDLLYWMTQQLGIQTAYTPDDPNDDEKGDYLPDLTEGLMGSISEKLSEERDDVFVLLLDGVYSQPAGFLRLLEQHLLHPLMAADFRVMLIMSGRGEMHRWITPFLLDFSIKERLGHFDEEGLKIVLKKHGYATSGIDFVFIYDVSWGYPLPALITAKGLQERKKKTAILNELIDTLYEFIPEEPRAQVLTYVEGLCTLNPWHPSQKSQWGFRKQVIDRQMETYRECKNTGVQQMIGSSNQDIFGMLHNYHILRWNDDASGYILDEVLRIPVAKRMELGEKDVWTCLHRHAYEQHCHKTSPYYKTIAKAHRKELKQISGDTNCPSESL